MGTRKLRVDIWNWVNNEAVLEVLGLPDSVLVGVIQRDGGQFKASPFPCEGFELDRTDVIPKLKWIGNGEAPQIRAEVQIGSGRKLSDDKVALIGSLAPYVLGLAAAALSVVATNLKADLDAYNGVVTGRLECKGKPNLPMCLSDRLADEEVLRKQYSSLKKEQADLSNLKTVADGRIIEQTEDLRLLASRVSLACPVDDPYLCVKYVADKFIALAKRAGCNKDDKKTYQGCIQIKTSGG